MAPWLKSRPELKTVAASYLVSYMLLRLLQRGVFQNIVIYQGPHDLTTGIDFTGFALIPYVIKPSVYEKQT